MPERLLKLNLGGTMPRSDTRQIIWKSAGHLEIGRRRYPLLAGILPFSASIAQEKQLWLTTSQASPPLPTGQM